ncbi:MAG: hypothetical protein ABSE51_02085 [Terracidiphilus sp.]
MQLFFLLRLRTESADREILTPKLVESEIKRVQALLARGTIRDAWKRSDGVSVVLLFDGKTEVECQAVINTLPFSQAGILEIQMVVPVDPYLDIYPMSESG